MELCLYTEPGQFSESHAKGKHVIVIDVLRASSTIVQACENGVERIIPVARIEDASRLASTLDRQNTLIGGEREGKKIEGFDLGNSPFEYTADVVRGKNLVFTTSNGTVAIAQSGPAEEVSVGCFLNLGAVVSQVLSAQAQSIAILCAGNLRQLSLEDFVCGGFMVDRIERGSRGTVTLNDAATAARTLALSADDIEELLRRTTHGQHLASLGFDADLEFCSRIDRYSTVPIVEDGRICGQETNRRQTELRSVKRA
jgi:2-phosphosulfolactate phosphatase